MFLPNDRLPCDDIWLIETMIQCWEKEVEIKTFMKCRSFYTTHDNAEVKFCNTVVVCQFQPRHIHHVSMNIATSVIGGRRWHGI